MPSSARGKNLFMRGDEGIAPYIIQLKRPCKLKNKRRTVKRSQSSVLPYPKSRALAMPK